MKAVFGFLSLAILVLVVSAERKRYDGYKVLEVKPTRWEQVKTLGEWMNTFPYLDFWKEPSRTFKPVVFMVPPEHLTTIYEMLRDNDMKWTIYKDDIQTEMDEQWAIIEEAAAKKKTQGSEPYYLDLDQYQPYDEVMAWVDYLPTVCAAGLTCETYVIGQSVEGRDIKVLRLSKGGPLRESYYVDAVTHAREWISNGVILKMMDNFVRNYGTDATVTRLIDDFDWYFNPVMNPDGYDYSWTSDRLWRKNRGINAGSSCIGVDLNRNFDFRWGTDGVSHEPCQQTYCGASPADQPETQAVMLEGERLRGYINAYVTFHAYGSVWIFPWGNTIDFNGVDCEFAADHADLMAVATAGADATEATHNTVWDQGNSCDLYYATSGATEDYLKAMADVKYGYCIELRGGSFDIPASEIQPAYEETYNGIVAMVDEIAVIP